MTKLALAALLERWEARLCAVALLLMALLPVSELLLRTLAQTGIPGSTAYVQHLTLWVGFLGAMVAARAKQHLTFVPSLKFLPQVWQRRAELFSAIASTTVCLGLAWASVDFVHSQLYAPMRIAGWLPLWILQTILPTCFGVIALRFISDTGRRHGSAIVVLGALGAVGLASLLSGQAQHLLWPGIVALCAAALCGAPIFVILGGLPLMLFFADGGPIASIPVETYRLVVSPSIPTIPLFALTGYLLAEGGASRRLFRLLSTLFGWLPGGLPIVAILLCAFFTTFTGASGVTILALGGLLLPVLLQSGCRENFSLGLLTASGSIGILFPPSLPVILYAVIARVPIPELFKAGVIPGMLLVATLCVFGFWEGFKSSVPRPRFDKHEAGAALWRSKWDILLPVITLLAMFGGYCTLIEAAAITAVYALFLETVIYRELHVTRDLPRVLLTCVTMMGGVFIILGSAMGLTNYLIDAQIPMQAAAWVQEQVHSRVLFLLVLNLFLFAVGCLMDIYSAIVVQAPLLLPISEAFGIDPLHLGIIFLANLELGYLTPPVGLNLFLASYRFDKPVLTVFRDTLPFLLVLIVVVLLITYVPALTLGTH
ncbi:MAG: TRAP transporter large permease subunit [Candidatus Binatia bacterium]